MKLVVPDPNFSVIVPGKCNASCSFCCWKFVTPLGWRAYEKKVKEAINYLPKSFQKCTITGGEPTTFKQVNKLAELLRKRFPKIVLSTNGARLALNDEILDYVDHINLSRHHHIEEEAKAIFETNTVPSDGQIKHICKIANEHGVDVTINAVLPRNPRTRGCGDPQYVREFVDYAKRVGASSVKFRKMIGSLDPHGLEKNCSKIYKPTSQSECKVCRSTTFLIDGMPVMFIRSKAEPSKELDGAYEAILQPNGKLTADWEGKTPLEIEPDISDLLGRIRAPDIVINDDETPATPVTPPTRGGTCTPASVISRRSMDRLTSGSYSGGHCGGGGGHCS